MKNVLNILFFISICLPFSGYTQKYQKLLKKEKEQVKYDYIFFEANKYKIIGSYSDALALFMECIVIDKKNPAPYYEISRIYQLDKDYNNALKFAEEAVKLSSVNEWYKLNLANIYIKRNEHDQAVKIFEEIIDRHPDNISYLYEFAALLQRAGEYKDCIDILSRIEARTGKDEAVSLEKYRVYLKLGEDEKAENILNELIELNPTKFEYYGLLAEESIEEKDYENALKIYNRGLKSVSEKGYMHIFIAELYLLQEKYDMAADELIIAYKDEALDVNVKVETAYNYFLLNSTLREDTALTGRILDTLYKTHPDDIKVKSMMGDYFYKRKEFIRAKSFYREILDQEKKNYLLWEQMLMIDQQLRDYESMQETSREAITYFPNQPVLYLFNGISNNHLKKYEDAIFILDAGLIFVMDDPRLEAQFYNQLADVYYKSGAFKKAFVAFDNILEINPSDILTLNNYSYYLALQNTDLEKAERMIEKVIKKHPENHTYLDTYAWVLYKSGKYEEALKYIEKAIRNGGQNNAVILEHYGDIMYKNGNREKALEIWKDAQSAGKGTELLEQKILEGKLIENKP